MMELGLDQGMLGKSMCLTSAHHSPCFLQGTGQKKEIIVAFI
jgi:hypothetical protein